MLLLIDANNLFMRAHFATAREHMSAGGENTAALVVFAEGIVRHIRTERPDRVAVCWDGGRSDYRAGLLPSYKSSRAAEQPQDVRTQRDQVREFLAVAGIHQIVRPGFEADDLVSRYWYDAEEPVVIVSNDKDFFQLAGANPQGHPTEIVRLSGGGAPNERWNARKVREHTGVPPRHIPSWMAITGDPGDDVPGVQGIGPKKALQALQGAGWVLESIEDPAIRQAHAQVVLSRLLVNLRLPVPGLVLPRPPKCSPTTVGSAMYGDFVRFLQQYRMARMLSRLSTGRLWEEDE